MPWIYNPFTGKLDWTAPTPTITPGGSSGQIQLNNGGAFGGASGITTNGTELTIVSGTKTANAPIQDLTQTWNAAGVTFTGWQLNVTNTASNASSLLMDLQVNGTGLFRVRRNGTTTIAANGSSGVCALAIGAGTNTGIFSRDGYKVNISSEGYDVTEFRADSVALRNNVSLNWADSGQQSTLVVLRDATNILAQRNGANAQESRVYGTFTDASNYRRLSKGMSTAGIAYLRPEGAGTGASGNVLHISGLPTSNPGPGILWNDAGTVKVGT